MAAWRRRKQNRMSYSRKRHYLLITSSLYGNDGGSSVKRAGFTIVQVVLNESSAYVKTFEDSTDSMLCPCAPLEWISRGVLDGDYVIVHIFTEHNETI